MIIISIYNKSLKNSDDHDGYFPIIMSYLKLVETRTSKSLLIGPIKMINIKKGRKSDNDDEENDN